MVQICLSDHYRGSIITDEAQTLTKSKFAPQPSFKHLENF